MSDHTRKLTDGTVWRALASVSAPMSLGILGVLSVGLVDAYFLGQLGTAELAAVGFIYPVTAAITSLSIGLSAGANAALSQAIGRDADGQEVNRLALHTVGLGLCVGALTALLFWLVHPALFSALGASERVTGAIAQFIPWWALSFPFMVVSMSINAAFRAHGDGTTSAVFMLSESALNIALTPLLIFGWGAVPGFDVAGAAMATCIARATMMCAAILWARHKTIMQVCDAPFKGVAGSVKTVAEVGLPAAFSNAINPAGMALVTAAVAVVGEAAVAGFGAAGRVQSLALVPLLALSSGIGPVVGQNWGADQQDRARRAVLQAWGFCVLYGLSAALVLTTFADPIAGLLAANEEDAAYAAQYLRIVSWSFLGYGILVTANAAMNARSKALWSTGLSLTRIFAIYLPLAWLGVSIFGYGGILAAAVLANLVAVAGAVVAGRATGLVGSTGDKSGAEGVKAALTG